MKKSPLPNITIMSAKSGQFMSRSLLTSRLADMLMSYKILCPNNPAASSTATSAVWLR
jgi:hypothetical protein